MSGRVHSGRGSASPARTARSPLPSPSPAMAKSSNLVDAHRKSLKKKELARNKQARDKAREVAVVKKDTTRKSTRSTNSD